MNLGPVFVAGWPAKSCAIELGANEFVGFSQGHLLAQRIWTERQYISDKENPELHNTKSLMAEELDCRKTLRGTLDRRSFR